MQKTFVPQQIPEPVIHVEGEVPSDTPAFNLFRAVVRELQGNVVFSPDSAEKLLLLLQSGAAGRTRAQLYALFADDTLKLKPNPAGVQREPFSSNPAHAAGRGNAWCAEKCYAKVDELGTEAAAVSLAIMVSAACVPPQPPPSIRFGKPFIWAIGDLTTPAPPYFIGLCEQP